jgi:hypothetical protein
MVENSCATVAAKNFLAVAWNGAAPSDASLVAALDQLIHAYHAAPDVGPSQNDQEPPREDWSVLSKTAAVRFPKYGLYPFADPVAPHESALMMGDAIDDIVDLTLAMREVIWLAEHAGVDDAHWYFRLHFFHWGQHARSLSLYLHCRCFA